MVDRLAELGALQYAAANTATASVNPSRIAASGYIHAMYAEYVTWSLANPGVNPSRLSAKGRIFGYFYDNATFSPLSLFAASEVGAWYDPSDLSTMFQDSAGTTPVTADGQPVGLILDKSKGLALGPELVTNGDFATDITGVVQDSGLVVWDSGGLSVTDVAGTDGRARIPFSGASNKTYKVTFVIRSSVGQCVFLAGDNSSVGVGNDLTTTITLGTISTPTTFSYTWKCSFASPAIGFLVADTDQTLVVESVSIKELPGNHATQATAASRPLKTSTGAAYWINYDAVDDVLNTTFPSSLGSACTVCRANVGGAPTILTGQTIGTSYADSTDNAELIIINRALTGQETTDVTAWLTAKGATA